MNQKIERIKNKFCSIFLLLFTWFVFIVIVSVCLIFFFFLTHTIAAIHTEVLGVGGADLIDA